MLKENMIIKFNKCKYRVIGFDNYNDTYFLMNLEENIWPTEIKATELEDSNSRNNLEVNELNTFVNVEIDGINQELLRHRDYIYEIVLYLENKNTNNELYRKKTRKPIIEETIERYRVSYNSIKKYLIIYWKSGRCKDSLIPKIYKCGGKNKEKKILNPHIKRGRKSSAAGVNIDEKFKRAFRVGINKYYNNERKNTIKIAYELTLRDFIKENQGIEVLPTYQQFYYWFNKFTMDKKKNEIIKREGGRIYQQQGREIIGNSIEDAISNLGIQIQNTPPYRGDYKGIVEKFFDVLHSYLRPFVDGYVENGINKVQRGAKDYRLKANLTLREITKIIVKCIIFHNNNHVLDSYVGDSLSIEENIPRIPIKLWEYGIKNKKGLLRELPNDVVKINLLHNTEALVTEKGVKFRKLYYVSNYSLSEGWFQKARMNGSYKVRISYDDGDLSRIYFIKEDGSGFDTLELVNYLDKYKNLSEEEISKLIEYELKLNSELKDKELKEKFQLYDEIEEITNNAREEAKMTKDISMNKSNRLKGIGENLELERKINREPILKTKFEVFEKELSSDLDVFDEIENDMWSEYYE